MMLETKSTDLWETPQNEHLERIHETIVVFRNKIWLPNFLILPNLPKLPNPAKIPPTLITC